MTIDYFFFNQIILQTVVMSPSSTTILFPLPSPSNLSISIYIQKTAGSNGYQIHMVHQVVLRLSSSLYIKAGKCNPVWGIGCQMWTTYSEKANSSTLRSPKRRACYTPVTYKQKGLRQFHAGSLIVSYPLWVPVISSKLILWVFLGCSPPLWLLKFFLPL